MKTATLKLSSIMLVLSITLAAFLGGCKGTDEPKDEFGGVDPEALLGPYSIFEGGMTFYFDLREDRLTVYENGAFDSFYQNFYHSGVSDLEASKAGIRFEDVTFDGCRDLMIPQRSVDGVQYYYGFVWDEESKNFSFEIEFLDIGNPTVSDGCILGTESHNGEMHTTEYFYVNGDFTHEHHHEDEYLKIVEQYVRGYLTKESLTCEYTSWELIDNTACKKYFVYDGDRVIAAAGISPDGERVFYSALTESYYEILSQDDTFKTGDESYGKMEHTGEVFTYVATGFESLSDGERELYGKIYGDITSFVDGEYTESGAEKVIKAILNDHPEINNYCRYDEKNGVVTTTLYAKWAPYKKPSADELKAALEEYDSYTDGIINSIPVGLEPTEKYIFLAQLLQILSKEHSDDEPLLELLIAGDSKGEKLAATYKHLCEKASVYCSVDKDKNTILIGGEYVTVDVEDTFGKVPGSDEWMESFFGSDS